MPWMPDALERKGYPAGMMSADIGFTSGNYALNR
jgi:hypothetical protein